ncbi:MAG: hypothetical protein R2705_11195 [Ilumatobacteraceae bacterium]
MHGTGLFNAMSNLMIGGSVTTPPAGASTSSSCSTPSRRSGSTRCRSSAMRSPILRALDAEPERWDLSSLRVVISSGVMWSAETKAGLLRHNDRLIMIDSLGSSEAISMASNRTPSAGAETKTRVPTSVRMPGCSPRTAARRSRQRRARRVALRWLHPGRVLQGSEKSAATFPVRTGSGTPSRATGPRSTPTALRLLGRGSQCINTGGEKVYPEEVEEILKPIRACTTPPSSGSPTSASRSDHRAGRAAAGRHGFDERAVIDHVKQHLAIQGAEGCSSWRARTGPTTAKLDYRALKSTAVERSV